MIETANWQALESSAIRHRRAGDGASAIAELEKALSLTRDVPALREETAIMLNYLAETCLSEGLLDRAERTIREALERTSSETRFLADDLLVLARIMQRQGRRRECIDTANEGLRLVRKEYGPAHEYTRKVEALVSQVTSV